MKTKKKVMVIYYKNMLGKTYGNWKVVDIDPNEKKRKLICQCKCGKIKHVDTYSLKHNGTKSCGKCNRYIDEKDYMKCIMKDGAFFIFDHEDLDLVKNHTWSLARGHVRTSINGKYYFLHRMIMNADNQTQVDHINRNKLDNRKCNLRFATHQQNQCNKGIPGHNTTGYKGVCFIKCSQKFISYINNKGVRRYLGSFDNARSAAKEYNKFALKLHGEFAGLNEI